MNWILFGVSDLLVTKYFSIVHLVNLLSDLYIFYWIWDFSTGGAKKEF